MTTWQEPVVIRQPPAHRLTLSVSLLIALVSLAVRYTFADLSGSSVAASISDWGPILPIECWAASLLLAASLAVPRLRVVAHWVAFAVLAGIGMGGVWTVSSAVLTHDPDAAVWAGFTGLAIAAAVKAAALALSYREG